jgi:hypothetical protein
VRVCVCVCVCTGGGRHVVVDSGTEVMEGAGEGDLVL